MKGMATRGSRATSALTLPSASRVTAGWMLRTGRVLSGLLGLFLLFDGVARLVGFAPYVEGTVTAGYPESFAPGIGFVLIVGTLLYLAPRTAILGAILLTGYLGGAVASHLRVGQPLLFPVLFGALLWGALYLVDPRLRELVPLRRVVPPGRR